MSFGGTVNTDTRFHGLRRHISGSANGLVGIHEWEDQLIIYGVICMPSIPYEAHAGP